MFMRIAIVYKDIIRGARSHTQVLTLANQQPECSKQASMQLVHCNKMSTSLHLRIFVLDFATLMAPAPFGRLRAGHYHIFIF
jgi:hypothetical protein